MESNLRQLLLNEMMIFHPSKVAIQLLRDCHWLLPRVPQQLIGERITLYNPEKKCIQVGIIKNFDSIKVVRSSLTHMQMAASAIRNLVQRIAMRFSL